MSIYTTNFTIDELTGEVKLIKHLNKIRADKNSVKQKVGGWNKSGKNSRLRKWFEKGLKKKEYKEFKQIQDLIN